MKEDFQKLVEGVKNLMDEFSNKHPYTVVFTDSMHLNLLEKEDYGIWKETQDNTLSLSPYGIKMGLFNPLEPGFLTLE